nr:allergen Fra a 1-like [Quercus suber]POE98440.1 major allergen pru ar 1 [Quercus suber]
MYFLKGSTVASGVIAISDTIGEVTSDTNRLLEHANDNTLFESAKNYKFEVCKPCALEKFLGLVCFSVIEGDALFDKLEKISTETKIVASPDRGSIVKTTSKYQTKGDIQLPDEQIREGKEKASRLFRAVEAYLVAHPDLYN